MYETDGDLATGYTLIEPLLTPFERNAGLLHMYMKHWLYSPAQRENEARLATIHVQFIG